MRDVEAEERAIQNNREFDRLFSEVGHTKACAAQMVWSSGVCICNLKAAPCEEEEA